jgi:hypothetical protein
MQLHMSNAAAVRNGPCHMTLPREKGAKGAATSMAFDGSQSLELPTSNKFVSCLLSNLAERCL